SLFSTLTLTGSHIPKPITLSRVESFPARRYNLGEGCFETLSGVWKAAYVPKNRGHLALELGDRLGSGRSGWVYKAEVVSVQPPEGQNAHPILCPTKSALCIKIARPNRCRTLAREAWIYERLPEPHSYYPSSEEETSPMPSDGDPTRDDDLPDDEHTPDDDPLDYEPKESDGEFQGSDARELSEWLHWISRPRRAAAFCRLLLMSRGGPAYS
ncbi:uncharacterized protein BXZ73DRAFT_10228, partial [Epithele typhae]|uniref:uncharacterized protein n=1 Tax=Epithele typhae TaxID=378194 RepID=UPI002007AB92